MLVSDDSFFSHIPDIKMLSEAIDEITEIKARVLKQLGRIIFLNLYFINF